MSLQLPQPSRLTMNRVAAFVLRDHTHPMPHADTSMALLDGRYKFIVYSLAAPTLTSRLAPRVSSQPQSPPFSAVVTLSFLGTVSIALNSSTGRSNGTHLMSQKNICTGSPSE